MGDFDLIDLKKQIKIELENELKAKLEAEIKAKIEADLDSEVSTKDKHYQDNKQINYNTLIQKQYKGQSSDTDADVDTDVHADTRSKFSNLSY